MTRHDTKVMMVPGEACALCGGQDGRGLHVAVLTPDGRPLMPRVCQGCVSAFGAVYLQLLGHAGGQVAALVVSLHNTGHAQIT